MSGETDCCLDHCCILNGCKCRESKNIQLYCCLAADIGYPYHPSCDEPGGCRSQEFTCLHTCCSLRDYGCCNPCHKPGGCQVGEEDGYYECCDNRPTWAELLNQ